mmetsp:Transcript_3250/g.6506  ORF Transcript_3250/g.6506 Transcript_3250/m.6506 type:complete len:110 (-) Transcript_3250:282-611(-)
MERDFVDRFHGDTMVPQTPSSSFFSTTQFFMQFHDPEHQSRMIAAFQHEPTTSALTMHMLECHEKSTRNAVQQTATLAKALEHSPKLGSLFVARFIALFGCLSFHGVVW